MNAEEQQSGCTELDQLSLNDDDDDSVIKEGKVV